MQQIHSPRDFEAMLHAEQAVVLVYFEWSSNAVKSRETFSKWQRQELQQSRGVHCSVYELAPDGNPFMWGWVGGIRADQEEDRGDGVFVWLRKGTVVASVPDAGRTDIKTLARVTDLCFTQGKTLSPEAIASLQNEPAPLDKELLKILCCPETHQALALAEVSVLEKLNEEFTAGRLRNRGGQLVTRKIEDGLVRADGRYLYPMRRNIPILLVDEAIPLRG